jgi:hypothetical protein
MFSKLKRLPIEWEKIFSCYTSDKGLIIRTYIVLKKLKPQTINDSMKKWTNKLHRAFSKEEVQIAENLRKMLNIFSHKGNANQHHVTIPPHSC